MKKKSVLFTLAVCFLVAVMLTGCQSNKIPASERIAETEHMTVEGCKQGLKIILKNARDTRIDVYFKDKPLPVYMETEWNVFEYYFPFTEYGNEYKIVLQGNDTKTGKRFNNEIAKCTALGGNKFEDCIDLTKFLNSQLAGETKNRLQYVKLEYTEINNVNDIVKNLDVINSIVFEFNLLLGESNHSISQVGFAEKVPDKMDGFLGLMLRTPREFDRLGRLPAEDYETNLYSYEWRLKFSVKDKNSVYKGRFVTESIRSPLFYFGTSRDNVIISPSLTLWGDVPNHDNNTNWIHTRGSAGGGNLSLADNYFESTAGESKNITWTDFEKLVFSIDGGSRDNEEFHIYIEGEDSSGNKFEKELCERYILEFERIQEVITIFIEDINTFKKEHAITDDSLRLSLRTGDNADFGILALKFE